MPRKLSDEDRDELLRLHAAGSSLNDLAAAFGVTPQHVGRVVRAEGRSGAEDASGRLLTLEEAERLLAKAARKGSIGALKLWFDRHATEGPVDDDPFAQFDPSERS